MASELRLHGGGEGGPLLTGSGPKLLDLSVNVNPYGPSQAVLEAIRSAPLERYPEPTSREAREALAARFGWSDAEVVLGPGAADLLWTLVRALLRAGDRLLLVEPMFSELRAAAQASEVLVRAFRAHEEDDFAIDLDAVATQAETERVRMVAFCSPGNPTGRLIDPAAIAALASRLDAHVVVDESFLSLSRGAAALEVPLPPNVIRVRSLTKDFALPGLRVGYLRAKPAVAARIEAARPPWSTSAPAQAAAIAAMREDAFVASVRARLLDDRARQTASLRAIGARVLESDTLFALLALGPRTTGAELQARLLERHRVLVRDCASFGLPHHLRVCARPAADDARVIRAFQEELAP